MVRPWLKYPGGKASLLPAIWAAGPWDLWSDHNRTSVPTYHEVFLGGGALYLSLLNRRPDVRARLSDSNEDLIDSWRTLIDVDPLLIRSKLEALEALVGEAAYYTVREDFRRTSLHPFTGMRAPDGTAEARATRFAMFVYLNRRGFNGLVRYGPDGFSTPFGKTKQRIFHPDILGTTMDYVRKNMPRVVAEPFEKALMAAPRGSMIYADPPYVPRKRGSFTRYSGEEFGYDDHERLRDHLAEASSHSWFIHSNLDTPWVRDAYSDFAIYFVQAKRTISRNGDKRDPENEVIITGGPGVRPGRFRIVDTFGVPKVVPAE